MKLTLSIEKEVKLKTEEKKCATPSKGAGRRQSVISVWFKIHMRFFFKFQMLFLAEELSFVCFVYVCVCSNSTTICAFGFSCVAIVEMK